MSATERDIMVALQFGACVAIKAKEDYGLTIDTYTGDVWKTLYDEYEAGVTVAQAAFVVCNEIQRKG